MDKWVCKRCGKEVFVKPEKNKTCECKGRFRKYTKCSVCGEWFLNVGRNNINCDACNTPKAIHDRIWHTVKCARCGKEFERRYSDEKDCKNSYCSKKCMKEHLAGDKVERVCRQCGKKFTVNKSTLKSYTNASGHYCSRECYWKSMTIESDKCYKGFRTSKRKYFGGDKFCAMCGATKEIHIHHIVPNRLTHDQSKENLIPICTHCHPKVERITRRLLKEFQEYDMVKLYMGNILRTYQLANLARIKDIVEKNN